VLRLTPEEAWEFLTAGHTGILTTLRRDGWPVTLPVWFVVLDRTVCFAAPSRTRKVARLRHDSRATFLVETGERWAELQAVHVQGHVEVVEDDLDMARIDDALTDKYAGFRTDRSEMPEATQRHYAGRTFFRLRPEGKVLSWDNRRLLEGGAG
jgi:PPOX class probable F420-dependent enzyme